VRPSTKVDLVLDAVAPLSQTDVDRNQLRDTGRLREDLVAMNAAHDQPARRAPLPTMPAGRFHHCH
jgi:hypothetical protein